MNKKYIVSLFLLVSVYADAPTKNKNLNVKKCDNTHPVLNYNIICEGAYKSNASLLSTKASLEAQELSIGQSASGFYPTINGSVSVSPSISKSRTRPLYPNSSDPTSSRSADISKQLQLSQSLFSGGSTLAGIRQAKYNIEGAKYQLAAQEAQLFEQCIAAYLTLCGEYKILKLLEEVHAIALKKINALKNSSHHTDASLAAAHNDAAEHAELSQDEQAVQSLEQALSQQKTAYASAQQAYTQLTALTSPVVPKYLPCYTKIPGSSSEASKIAMEQNQSILAAIATLKATTEQKTIATASLLPTLNLSASLTKDYNKSKTPPNDSTRTRTFSKQAGLNLGIPLYTPGVWSQRQQQIRTMVANKYSVIAAQQQAQQGVATAYTQFEQAQTQYKQAKAAAVKATPANLMNATVAELQQYIQAQTAALNAEMAYQKAIYQLVGALGLMSAQNLGIQFRACDYYNQFAVTANKKLGA